MIKGNAKEKREGTKNVKYVGLTEVDVKAINPTRAEIAKLYGTEADEDEKPLEYLSEDQEQNPRIRLSFWLYDILRDKYFIHSFNLTKKVRKSRDGMKVQVINSTLNTTWIPFKLDSDGQVTDEPNYDLLPTWFTNFTDRDKNEIGAKKFRPALLGEEELATLLRSWLGGLNFNHPEAEVFIDTDRLFDENYSELRELIGSEFVRSFVATLGVETDENDNTKKYQKVWGKQFLPEGFITHLERNFKDSSDYVKRIWDKFESEITGEYGFTAQFELKPLMEYDPDKDIANFTSTRKAEIQNPVSPKF